MTMKANELRIGNYIQNNELIINDVIELGSGERIIDLEILNFVAKHPDSFLPIAITEEWLVNKFGFKNNMGGYYQHAEYNFFLFHNEEDEYFDCYKQVPANDDTGDFKTLQHVHKLQNLFFELFDEEL